MDTRGRASEAAVAIAATEYRERTRGEGREARELAVVLAGGDRTNPRHLELAARGVPAAWADAPLSYLARAIAALELEARS